jgi:hypothetical protein
MIGKAEKQVDFPAGQLLKALSVKQFFANKVTLFSLPIFL